MLWNLVHPTMHSIQKAWLQFWGFALSDILSKQIEHWWSNCLASSTSSKTFFSFFSPLLFSFYFIIFNLFFSLLYVLCSSLVNKAFVFELLLRFVGVSLASRSLMLDYFVNEDGLWFGTESWEDGVGAFLCLFFWMSLSFLVNGFSLICIGIGSSGLSPHNLPNVKPIASCSKLG